MAKLHDRCAALWRRLAGTAPPAQADACAKTVTTAYAGKGRFYHTQAHLKDVLKKLDWAKTSVGEARRLGAEKRRELFDTVELALWYHDAVYDAQRHDNEEKSRDLLLAHAQKLNLSPRLQRDVGDLILLTKQHGKAKTLEERLMADCDLAILGASKRAFAAYDADIRREYAHVPPDAYATGRAAVLERFQKTRPLFLTAAFRRAYGRKADRNLRAALAKTKAATGPKTP
jgi:predicted metal-dependent HD superfamily phosphohydrolase